MSNSRGLRCARARGAGRRDEMAELRRQRPAQHDNGGEHRGDRDGAARGIGAPGDGERRDDHQGEDDQRRGIVPGRERQEQCAEEIGRQRGRRHGIDLAGRRVGTPEQARHDQRRDQREARDHVEEMRRKPVDMGVLHARQRPEESERHRGDREPQPHPHARERKGRRRHHGDVDVERPVVRLAGRNQQRRDEGADQAERGQRRAVQQRRGERRQRHHAEQHEGEGGIEEAVKAVGRVDGGKGAGGAGRGQDARHVRARHAGKSAGQFVAAGPFAGCDEGGREQPAEEQPHAGPDQAGLDRIFDEEDAAERERHAADPDGPAGAELFFEALGGLLVGRGRRRRRWRWRRSRCGGARGFGCRLRRARRLGFDRFDGRCGRRRDGSGRSFGRPGF